MKLLIGESAIFWVLQLLYLVYTCIEFYIALFCVGFNALHFRIDEAALINIEVCRYLDRFLCASVLDFMSGIGSRRFARGA